ncbi:type II toxin-antitoxin system RelB/DinJ family antitoxin [Mesosutterella sp. AGMB02718]|uniref:Type II toxin-antitoxin system RelB/DinJ family antitoxin n=1 Tax=Mesosutterella faecium TaxID=2925194 RepID=A0ABT7IP98_9BURK|nr:type II toxin-antitoxin system RelB/DinJ family antitoxin [Mesosutterella sp. AGMB02718]MDL2059790.1 type II toxin-antitoxin system RelB/DinJ family antitoxin [Mesosutterella sp. AGMB02718]
MAEKLPFTVNIDKDLKEKAEALLSQCGLTLDAAVNSFLEKMVSKGSLPLDIGALVSEGEDKAKLSDSDPENSTTLTRSAASILSSLRKKD